MRSRRSKAEVQQPADPPLAEEWEAFLAGRMAEHLGKRGRPAPPWVLLNRIAHGSRNEVEEIAHDTSRSPFERELALAALAAAGSDEQLSTAQRDHLVPLELDLIGQVVSSRRVLELASMALFMSS